ncbi:hypothetical protein BU15DRAFT_15861, partial [Melanogaster broomeanus]
MSIFEPKTVLSTLQSSSVLTLGERNKFKSDWATSVKKRVKTWKDLPAAKASLRPLFQLEWEAEVVEYVNFVWKSTRLHKKGMPPKKLPYDVPLLGPHFMPPTQLHASKRPGTSTVSPEIQYLKPLNVVHPFYYPELAQCPQCRSCDKINWEGWTGTGAREIHGLFVEEAALGLQLRCNAC